jgi:hypothetical protein
MQTMTQPVGARAPAGPVQHERVLSVFISDQRMTPHHRWIEVQADGGGHIAVDAAADR